MTTKASWEDGPTLPTVALWILVVGSFLVCEREIITVRDNNVPVAKSYLGRQTKFANVIQALEPLQDCIWCEK